MKFRAFLSLLTLLFLLPHVAHGQGGLDFTIPDVVVNQGDVFTISATLFNTSATPIFVNSYSLMSTGSLVDMYYNDSPGANYSALLGDYYTESGHTYAPTETQSGEFLKFTPNGVAPPGDYTVTVNLSDTTTSPSTSVTQTSFNVHIQAVPEFGTTLSVAGLLGAGGYGLWRQRRQRRPTAAGSENPRFEP